MGLLARSATIVTTFTNPPPPATIVSSMLELELEFRHVKHIRQLDI